ncbi:CPBP family intramembrane glutamic endopeptidase [Gracilibacillus sp. S3-1-1]|uniref:CPBP family intramembrane glutamic endopeptidase n=1 Tax=Gracilibacillus pellucidus TaxID=3095368 RepID=A0ACC6M0J2_9BACI|nr:CPBP family intramembrane glutamic endopeptidase [Gracilibacillus sp. S3-1-1]MDX8044458.1 CPBP family intramembrane glutamic endopeptidase [Gracilibacillus sp. S3-1-1]
MVQNKWKMKLTLLLTLLGAIGIIAIIPYEMTALMNDEVPQSLPNPVPASLVMTINSIIRIIFLFVLVLFGVRLQKRTSLRAPIFEALIYDRKELHISTKWIGISIAITFIGSLVTILLDLFVFTPFITISQADTTTMVWWEGLLASLYGGITEELMLRLFVMTLIVWILAKITQKQGSDIPRSFYVTGIILATILFGLGHLPATIQLFGELSPILLIRALVLNGMLGLWFGYLYWKKGLEYAIIAHMAADIFIHVLFASVLG